MAGTLPWWRTLSDNIVRVGLAALVILLIANLIRSVEQNYAISREIRTLNTQIADERDQAAIITEENAYYRTDTYHDLEARARLGVIAQGEKLVLVPQNRDSQSGGGSNGTTESDGGNEARKHWDAQPPYEQWRLLFFGSQTLLEETFGS